MDNRIDELLKHVEKTYGSKIQRGARHYLEVNLAEQALKLELADLGEKYNTACAIIPLKAPQNGMKVRIAGRTFVNYAEYESGIAIPVYLATASGRKFRTFVPNDSMICSFCCAWQRPSRSLTTGALDHPDINLVTACNAMTKRIEIDTPAPDFELPDFSGRSIRLSDYRDHRHVILVFNRGFV